MSGLDDYDIADSGVTENWPSPLTGPVERSQPLRPAAVLSAIVVGATVAVCGLLLISWATGWAASEISRWLP